MSKEALKEEILAKIEIDKIKKIIKKLLHQQRPPLLLLTVTAL